MIKKLLSCFLMILVSGFANANIHIDGKTVRSIVLEHIDNNYQVPALQEYNVQLKATGNYTMSAAGLYKVCIAAGWDIEKPEGKDKCDKFVQALVEKSDYKYYEVCGNGKGKSGGTEYCIDNVFDGLLSGIQVTMLQADGLCKEYAKVKYKDDIECSSQKRAGTINKANDYVKCTSKLKPVYYEFKFDDVVESSDSSILRGVLKGVGKIHNVDISDPGCTIERIINDTACNIGYKTTDIKICENLNNSLKRFGYTSKIGNVSRAGLNSEKLCAISGITTVSSNLKTAYGIPNDVFYDGLIQMQGSKDIKDGIKQYVADKIKPEKITSFSCVSNTIKMPSIKGKKDTDDVLTCYVNSNQIDFVFDDLSEASKLRNQGAKEAFQCTYNGGLLTGKRCLNVGEEACKKIAQSTFLVQECPECSKLYWDGNICTLPTAATANVLDKGLNIAMIVGGAALNVFVAIGTGGTSTAAGGWLLAIETVGSAIELGTEIAIDVAADNFFVESSKCHDKTCAKSLIEKHLQRLSNFYNRLTGAEEKAIDKEMARLFKLIPAEELFTVEALVKVDQENGGKKLASVKDNQKGFFDPKSWEPEQIWQAVGITMQIATLFYQIGSWAFGKSGKTAKAMTEVADVLDGKADEAMRAMAKNSDEVMDMWEGATSGAGNSLEHELTLLEELKNAKQAKTGSRLYSGVYEDLSEETKRLLVQNGNDIDATIRQLSKGMESVNVNTTKLNKELMLLDELENAKQAKTGSRLYSGVYDDLSEETKRLLSQNGNDISKTRQRLNLALEKIDSKPKNQSLEDFIFSPDLEYIGGEYSTFDRELAKLKNDVVRKQKNAEDATQALTKLQNAASDAVDAKLIKENAVLYKENLARILASDEDLLKQFNNFDNLSHDAKERLARTLINKHGKDLGVINDVDVSLIWEFPDDPNALGKCCAIDKKTGKRIIYVAEKNLGKAAKGNKSDGLIAVMSHEYGHFVDTVDPNKGVLGSQIADISKNFYGKGSNTTLEGFLIYKGKPTEKSSFPIGNIVGDNFSDAVRQTVTTGKLPTTSISKIEDFEIKYAIPKDWNTKFFENGGDSYFFIQTKPENITGLSNYFRQKGVRVQTTIDGVKIFE